MKYLLSTLLFILAINAALYSADYKWQRFSGKWEIVNSALSENQSWISPWHYYELLNLNSLISLNSFDEYSSIDFDFNVHDRHESPAEFSISFAVRSPYKKWFYHIYSIKLSGGFWGINRASFIHSDMKDKTLKYNTKNNIFIKELASESFRLKYGKKYKASIRFEKDTVLLYIDGEKVLTGKMPSENHSGRIAISTKNTKVTIDKIQVRNNNAIVFEDDFNTDTVYVKTMKAFVEKTPQKTTNN